MIDRLDGDGVANLNSNIFSRIPLNPVALTSHIVYTNDYVSTVCACVCMSKPNSSLFLIVQSHLGVCKSIFANSLRLVC